MPLKISIKAYTPQKHKNRQTTPKDFPEIPGFCKRQTRASCPALPGNMTVEAALVLPIFLFAMVNLLSLIVMFQSFSIQEGKLHQTGRELSLLAYGNADGEQDIRLLKVSSVKSVFPVAAFPGTVVANGCVMHKWIGYDLSLGDTASGDEKEDLVYVTKSGTAYHRQRECIYLNPSIQMMEIEQAKRASNSDGRHYTACSVCGGSSGIVYVTQDGVRYHSSVTCSGLKRTIDVVSLQEAVAAGRHACPRCG